MTAATVCAAMVALVGAAAAIAARPRVRRRPPTSAAAVGRAARTWSGAVPLPRWWSTLIADLGVPVPPGRGAVLALGLIGAVFCAGVAVGGAALGAVAAAASAAAIVLAGALQRGRQDRLVVAALPGALDVVARSSAAGLPPAAALREACTATAGPLVLDLQAVVARASLGEPLQAGLERWARVRPLAEVRLVVSGLVSAATTGAPVGDAAQRAAASLRARADARRVVATQAAQARASATMVGLAPVGVLGLMAMVDSSSARVLVGSPVGLACLGLGLAMDGLAVWWMAAMIRAAE